MDFIIFKINFSNYYNGIEDSSLNIYDKFYQEKKSNNPEIYNFQDYNGNCYGYAPLKDGVVNLSNTHFKNDTSTISKDALVLWVYEKNKKYFLSGWYKNASVYNFLQRELSYPSVGRDLYYNVKAKSENCFLLPIDERNLELDIDFENDTNFLIGDKTSDVYNKVASFISNYNKGFCNIVNKNVINLTLDNAPDNPISLYKRATIYVYNEGNFLEAIKYLNTALIYKEKLSEKELIDIYYLKAISLQFINDFQNSIIYFEKVIDFIEYDLNILRNMAYLYIYNKTYEKTISVCDKILNTEKNDDNSKTFLDEIIGLKIDALIKLNEYYKAKILLQNILSSKLSDNLKLHFKALLSALENI